VILVDANILLYAEDERSPYHVKARTWWDGVLSGSSPVCLCWTVFQQMLRQGQAVANLVTDAHLAALAVEHGCELVSTDADFSRFSGIRWRNPLR
jgi:predicted nucleic acid-binding protein